MPARSCRFCSFGDDQAAGHGDGVSDSPHYDPLFPERAGALADIRRRASRACGQPPGGNSRAPIGAKASHYDEQRMTFEGLQFFLEIWTDLIADVAR